MTDPGGEDLRLSVQKLSRRIRRNRPAGDISDSQLTVLMQLHAGGDLTPGRLAELEHVTPPSMNRTVNGLEQAGLVTRRPAPADARKVLVGLTPAGTELVLETRRLRSQWFSDRLSGLTDDERRILDAAAPLLRRLAES
jgi:DNA-binding MarR family transcriptional regulator